MAVSYSTVFAPLGAELQNQRKVESFFEHFHNVSNSQYSKRLILSTYSPTTDVYQEVADEIARRGYETAVVPNMGGMASTLKGNFEQGFFPVLDNQILTNPTDKANGAIAYSYDPTLTDGTQSILYRLGRWGALRRQMANDNQLIPGNTITFGSLVANNGNLGALTLGSVSGSDHTLTGTLTLVCTDDTVQAPKLSVVNVLTNKFLDPTMGVDSTGQFSQVQGDGVCQVGKTYQDGQTGITLLLSLGALSITDPNSLFSAVTVSNPTESGTNKGKIYIKVTRQASSPIWLIQWYKDAGFTQLVTSTTADGTSGNVVLPLMTEAGGCTVQATISTTNANANMPSQGNTNTSVVWNVQTPRVNDQWTITASNNELGNYATKIAHRYRASLNSAPNAPLVPGAPSAGGSVTVGLHSYVQTFVFNGVETCQSLPSAQVNVTTGGTQTVPLSAIPLGPSGTTARKIYRTVAGDTGNYLLLTTIGDNVTTTFNDTTADGSLGAAINVPIWDKNAASIAMT